MTNHSARPAFTLKTIGIIGAGKMGQGIATVFITNGYPILIYDVDHERLYHTYQKLSQSLAHMQEDKPNQGEITTQRLYTEPKGLNIDGDLPTVSKDSFKKGVYY